MFSKHSQAEMDQWHATASKQAVSMRHDASRQNRTRSALAKGQGERTASSDARTAAAFAMESPDDWASECLFDCYNG